MMPRPARFRPILRSLGAALALTACGTWGVVPPPAPPELPVPEEPFVRLDEGRGELVLELGPVDLPAGSMHMPGHGMGPQPVPRLGRIPISGWLTGYEVELVDGDGNPVPKALLHHMNLMAPDRRELFSPMMQRIGAAGEETAPVRLPGILGYPVTEGTRILLTAMLHNPTEESYGGVRVRVHVPYRTRGGVKPVVDVFPFYLDVMPPAGVHAYDLPPGRSEQSWEGKPAVSGRILAMGGHLHAHSLVLRLEDVTEGKVLWEAQPILGEDGELAGMPQKTFLRRLGLPIHADHTYRLTAVYDSPEGETLDQGAMGALGGVILPDGGQVWPPPFGYDSTYQKDLATIFGLATRADQEAAHHH